MVAEDPKLVALRFNEAINRRDLTGLCALMTEDHALVDSAPSRTDGRDAVRHAWQGFFTAFPDYQNEVSTVHQRGHRVFLLGRSVCAHPALCGAAIWVAVVRGGLLAEWIIYEDTPDSRRALALTGADLAAQGFSADAEAVDV